MSDDPAEGLDTILESLIPLNEGSWLCRICDTRFRKRPTNANFRIHCTSATHLDTLWYASLLVQGDNVWKCRTCDQTFGDKPTRNGFTAHCWSHTIGRQQDDQGKAQPNHPRPWWPRVSIGDVVDASNSSRKGSPRPRAFGSIAGHESISEDPVHK